MATLAAANAMVTAVAIVVVETENKNEIVMKTAAEINIDVVYGG